MALSTGREIEDFADTLMASADVTHTKTVAAASKKSISHEVAQQAFEQVSILRQEANSLYIDAAQKVLQGLEITQDEILGIIADAKTHIERIDTIEEGLDIVTQLLDLVAKVQSADIKGVIAVSKELKSQFKS
jgi:hypothetical protein